MHDRKRAKLVNEAICFVYDSLDSHLWHARKGKDKRFHKKCVREYSRIIRLLSKLY